MCKKGNQTIYTDCRDAIREALGRENISNHDMKAALAMLGVDGCMIRKEADKPVDKTPELVLTSD